MDDRNFTHIYQLTTIKYKYYESLIFELEKGLEPSRLTAADFESAASTNSATLAFYRLQDSFCSIFQLDLNC